MTTGAWVRVDDFFTTDFGSAVSFWGLFCSGEQPPVIYSTRNELQVFFTSNYTSGKQPDPSRNNGFYAIFEAVPQGNEMYFASVSGVLRYSFVAFPKLIGDELSICTKKLTSVNVLSGATDSTVSRKSALFTIYS